MAVGTRSARLTAATIRRQQPCLTGLQTRRYYGRATCALLRTRCTTDPPFGTAEVRGFGITTAAQIKVICTRPSCRGTVDWLPVTSAYEEHDQAGCRHPAGSVLAASTTRCNRAGVFEPRWVFGLVPGP